MSFVHHPFALAIAAWWAIQLGQFAYLVVRRRADRAK
jgi:hypothetical protein